MFLKKAARELSNRLVKGKTMTDKPNLNEQNTEVEATEDLSLGSYVSGGTLQVAKPKWYMPECLKLLLL
jgi:hypothetical protein